MKKHVAIIPFFKQFIRDTQTGKRLKKNGERIKPESIANYRYVLNNLIRFSVDTDFDLRICDASKLNQKEFVSEKNYWKKFYQKFTEYLYKSGCHDNYVGANVKVIRVFLNYLKNDKDYHTGDFQRLFYVRKEDIEIYVLSPDQLKFLIHDQNFQNELADYHKRVKDIFVFGCTTGLRYSDIFLLTNKNFEQSGNDWYLKMRSKKTKVVSQIKLPQYAVDIYHSHKSKSDKEALFGNISLSNYNNVLKKIGEQAGFTAAINISREKQGKQQKINKDASNRFCDKMSSHMMRRTAITTLLILGMPEHLVRKISGHTHTSTSLAGMCITRRYILIGKLRRCI